jgi:hypothetical protein
VVNCAFNLCMRCATSLHLENPKFALTVGFLGFVACGLCTLGSAIKSGWGRDLDNAYRRHRGHTGLCTKLPLHLIRGMHEPHHGQASLLNLDGNLLYSVKCMDTWKLVIVAVTFHLESSFESYQHTLPAIVCRICYLHRMEISRYCKRHARHAQHVETIGARVFLLTDARPCEPMRGRCESPLSKSPHISQPPFQEMPHQLPTFSSIRCELLLQALV